MTLTPSDQIEVPGFSLQSAKSATFIYKMKLFANSACNSQYILSKYDVPLRNLFKKYREMGIEFLGSILDNQYKGPFSSSKVPLQKH